MVIKTQLCRFSGLRVYPGAGIIFVRVDGQQYLLLNKKVRKLFHQRLRAQKIAWTASYRKAHKKDVTSEAKRRRRRINQKGIIKSIANAPLELINKKRNEKPEVRKASREAAVREVKERMKKKQEGKKTVGGAAGKGGGASKYKGGAPKGGAARTGTRR
ncbi:hypothetical protein BSKO_13377 [Bryopsis sp. KO-2023]|nr:hypothetical protein BSKO_13377 [Bryopsis sp. KO-2023]